MGRAIMIVLIFVAAGPLIGLATLSSLLAAFAAARVEPHETGDAAAFGALILMYGVLFAHFLGAIWAAIAGLIVALRASLWGPASIFEGVPIGTFTALASIVFWDIHEVEPGELAKIEVPIAAGWALVHIVPTMTCIWLTRGWQSPTPATS
jgi:hypothetical protein